MRYQIIASDVPPSVADADIRDVLLTDTEQFGDLALRESFASADGNDICISKLGSRAGYAAKLSALCNLIGHVIRLCSEKQMLRVHTGTIVAPMTDIDSLWNRTAMKFVRKAVCVHHAAITSKCAISISELRCCPFPTWRPVFAHFSKKLLKYDHMRPAG